MKLFGKKENKNKKENKGMGNDIINQLALQEALRELKEQKDINHKLSIKVLVLQEKIDTIIKTCEESKTSKIAKAILKELGE